VQGKLNGITLFFQKKYTVEICIFISAFIVFFSFSNHPDFVFYNNFSYLADSMLSGRLDVSLPSYLESTEFGGRQFVHFGPGPALLHLPFIIIWGIDGFNTLYLGLLLGASNAVLFYLILKNLKIGDIKERLWFTSFLMFGTVNFHLTSLVTSWSLGHISMLFFVFFAIYFLTVPSAKNQFLNLFLSGLFFGLAVTCRMSALLGVIFYLGYIFIRKKERLWQSISCFVAGMSIFGALYMLYNCARYGTITDQSYTLVFFKDSLRHLYDELQAQPPESHLDYLKELISLHGKGFHIKHIPESLKYLFLVPPKVQSDFPFLVFEIWGTALTFVSPALYFAASAWWKKSAEQKIVAWLLLASATAIAVPFMLFWANGAAQFGMRYSMDFMPYLILLSCMGLLPLRLYKKGVIVISVAVCTIWGVVLWN